MTATGTVGKEFDYSANWVFCIEQNGRFEWSNSRSEKVIGYTPGEIVKKPIQNFLLPECDFESIKKQAFEAQSFKIYCLPFKAKNGETVIVEAFLASMTVSATKEGVCCIVFARTASLLASKKAEEEEKITSGLCKKFVNILISLFPTPVFYTNKEARYIGCNKAFENFFGLSSEQIYGKTVDELFSGENTVKYYKEDLDLIKHNANQTKQVEILDGKKEKHNALIIKTVYPNENGEPAGMLGVIVDITPVKQEEDKKLRVEQEAQHAQKMASLALLAGGVAHDFNNMLTVILGNIELAISEVSPESSVADYLKEARSSCLKAADLCRQMLIYTGKSPFNKKPVNLNRVIQEMDQLLHAAISRRLYIQYKFTQPLPMVEADPNQIKQAIMSIVVNASEAMGDKPGVITITTGYMRCDKSYLETITPACRAGLEKPLKQGNYVFVEVTDTGCGIPMELQKKIFDPFFSTKIFGRGLGLAAVLGIVRTHQGGIKVYSEVGKGSTFKILLPINNNGKNGHSFPETKSQIIPKHRLTVPGAVLFADDEEGVRSVAVKALQRLGLNVYEASNGAEALIILNKHKDEIDYVMLDYAMPGLSAEEIFREMRLIKPGIKVILCSGYGEEQAIVNFRGKGLAGFLQKPFDIFDLLNKIISLLPPEEQKSFKKLQKEFNEKPTNQNDSNN
ncbi:MAG: ATP-binding protein [Verrucomicrobiae bacterium]|nr:ATP-binding protein [Verrucomicrobiae bacterium]